MGRTRLFRTKPKLLAEVLIRVATLPEFARHSSHKANDDFLYRGEALELGRPLYKVLEYYELGSGAMVEELCYAIKGDSLQIRREGDDTNVIF
jgi:hypothetical protein